MDMFWGKRTVVFVLDDYVTHFQAFVIATHNTGLSYYPGCLLAVFFGGMNLLVTCPFYVYRLPSTSPVVMPGYAPFVVALVHVSMCLISSGVLLILK